MRYETASVVRDFQIASGARPTPPVQHTPGVNCANNSLQVATYRRCLAVTVKPFEQRELHRSVTIRPDLGIPNQKVTQK